MRPYKGSWRQATSLQNFKKCSDNLVPEHQEIGKQSVASYWHLTRLAFHFDTKRPFYFFTIFCLSAIMVSALLASLSTRYSTSKSPFDL